MISNLQITIVKEILPISTPLLRGLEEIYTANFPPEQRADLVRVLNNLPENGGALFLAHQSEICLGFGILTPLAGCNLHFLDYLAVHPQYQEQMIGTALLESIKKFALSCSMGILLEVEPDNSSNQADASASQRRIRFYQRCGGRIITQSTVYRMPNLAGPGSIRMELMWIPVNPLTPPPTGDELCQWILEIYDLAYRLEADDPLVVQTLKENGWG